MVAYREQQRFTQPWLWLLLVLPGCLACIGLFGWGMVQQLLMGRPWGDRPMSDTELLVAGSISIVFCVAMMALLACTRLVTEVRADGLYLRFVPLHRRFRPISLDNLVSLKACSYRPIRDYGGWGIKGAFRSKGRSYTVKGHRGVRLDYQDGSHLLIGSQQPDQLAIAVQALLGEANGKQAQARS
jgi:hypothetical protein